ncbi:condensin subunit Smc [Palleronia aestuarii]|uniref:Chromosome partition protein Smc n=1 Tax=Palleronia aestuarii TaxID=568105 RepID=A0A2W7NF84_9RHOB|nr:AAA family ATPase [Palleronia aestuarii]PZX19085.1 condensin subunit Smc [Palleronia aestuarii]
MQFTRLRLTGFKSFVDPTDLVIQDGLTGVVGPNGCGKSNLLEALRWVMGESRPTAMRGGGMEDVIFAGTTRRPARNFAEVALHIDNAERLAPAAFNSHDAIEIVRRITRDAGSAYKAQGRDVRARDVQMLFADASTGAQSPALVRQGQIAELINARPTQRRRILEEAAGISGLYQRRHEAELKLKAAEANLTRVDSVVESLAAQLAQLARQARQAARYREIGAALRRAEGLLLYRRWREADRARSDAEAARALKGTEATRAERTAVAATRAREEAEAALPPLREEAAIAGALLQRLEVEQGGLAEREGQAAEKIAQLEARLAQIGRDAEREAGLNADADGTITRLEAEGRELTQAEAGFDEALAAAAAAAREAGGVLAAREGALAEITEEVARLAARHQSADREVAEAEGARSRAAAAVAKAREALRAAEAARAGVEGEVDAAEAEEAAASAAAERAEAEMGRAEAARDAAQGAEAETRARLSEAEGERGALAAEAGALEKIVARGAGGGTEVLDRVRVAAGFEKALGAALGDDLRAPEVEGGTGWTRLPDYDAAEPLPDGAAPLGLHVEAPEVLGRRIAQVGLVSAEAGPGLQSALRPGQRLVSRAGDLWRWDGYGAAAADAPSAAALRLEQLNRLSTLREALAALEARAAEARSAHDEAARLLREAGEADGAARRARREADTRLAEASRALSRADAARSLADGRRVQAEAALQRHDEEANAAAERSEAARAARDALDDLDALRARVATRREEVEAARLATLARRAAHDERAREGAAREKRQAAIAKELSTWRGRLASAGGRLADLEARRTRGEDELARARAVPETLAADRARLDAGIAEARARDAASREALASGEDRLAAAAQAERAAEREAGAAREARAGAEAQAEAARAGVAEAAARIEEAQGTTPDGLLETLEADFETIPGTDEIEADVGRLRRQRDGMGAVNLRAEADAQEVEAEHEELVREKADLEAAIATLRSGIAGLNREGRERLLAAFEEVNANFGTLFAALFGGGEARLELVESDDPLDAGLEILCQPPGKRLSTLSLLSGGEQTLTAMALIFAVFLANPAPICVLDEVDAPLDDANVTRFCDMLDEMTRRTRTRFLVITHHAVTMARMDRLFGVTMGEQGVSQLVSVDLSRAEAMVA